MNIIDNTLLYLRESLANYTDNDLGQGIYDKIKTKHYNSEEDFVDDLNDEEMSYLDSILKREMNYAKIVQDHTRVTQLNEVFELLL